MPYTDLEYGGLMITTDYDELALRLSKEWAGCQDLIDAFPAYVLVIDDEHRIVLANKAILHENHEGCPAL